VEYGAILEMARDTIERQQPSASKAALLKLTTTKSLLKLQLTAGHFLRVKRIPGAISGWISGESSQVDLPHPQLSNTLPPLNDSELPPIIGEVYFLNGCAMDVLHSRVHECSKRLLRRSGYQVREVQQGCCGALHAHNGHLEDAKRMASDLVSRFSEPIPVLVDSAGCGSTMKDYGSLAPGGEVFSKRVFDISEFLAKQNLGQQLTKSAGFSKRIAYHEACHLVHGQRISKQPNALIRAIPGATVVDLPESTVCCGSAGIYNVCQPKMARLLLEQKWEHIESCRPNIVATGNPGCHTWIAQGSQERGGQVLVLHTAELLEASFIGIDHFLT
jgi:glycolate oxidase iron-sulfur subunit